MTTIIPQARLEELLEKERAHDSFLAAMETVGRAQAMELTELRKAREGNDHDRVHQAKGWLRCLGQLNRAVIAAKVRIRP